MSLVSRMRLTVFSLCRYSHCASVHQDQLVITHGYFYNTETRGPQWLSDTWTMSLHSPYAMHEIHSAYMFSFYCTAETIAAFTQTLQLYLQRVPVKQQQQLYTRKRKRRLSRLAGMVHLQLYTMTSCGCLLALMEAIASMAMADMS